MMRTRSNNKLNVKIILSIIFSFSILLLAENKNPIQPVDYVVMFSSSDDLIVWSAFPKMISSEFAVEDLPLNFAISRFEEAYKLKFVVDSGFSFPDDFATETFVDDGKFSIEGLLLFLKKNDVSVSIMLELRHLDDSDGLVYVENPVILLTMGRNDNDELGSNQLEKLCGKLVEKFARIDQLRFNDLKSKLNTLKKESEYHAFLEKEVFGNFGFGASILVSDGFGPNTFSVINKSKFRFEDYGKLLSGQKIPSD